MRIKPRFIRLLLSLATVKKQVHSANTVVKLSVFVLLSVWMYLSVVELVILLCGEIGEILGVDGVGTAFGVAVIVCGSIGEARFGRIGDTSLW